MGPRTGMNVLEKTKISFCYQELKHDSPFYPPGIPVAIVTPLGRHFEIMISLNMCSMNSECMGNPSSENVYAGVNM
jgi:hypothetical protein